MRKIDLQQQAVELIKQLSTEKLKSVIDYLNYLQDKEEWEATHELASDLVHCQANYVTVGARFIGRWEQCPVAINRRATSIWAFNCVIPTYIIIAKLI